jgi:hypothetical protein
MPIPTYGAAPLSTTFLCVRVMQVVSLIIMLGLAGSAINQMAMQNFDPSREIVGTISIVRLPLLLFPPAKTVQASIVTLYTLVSIAFYWSIANLGLFVMAGADALILVAFIVVSVVVGKPVSHVNCYNLSLAGPQVGMNLVDILSQVATTGSGSMPLGVWNAVSKGNCFETKAIWGMAIALT